jgi:signal peptidase I
VAFVIPYKPGQSLRGYFREVVQTVALAAFLVLLIQSSVQNYRVEGPSMEPLFIGGDRVVVSKIGYTEINAEHAAGYLPTVDAESNEIWRPFGEPQRGDVIVFRWPRDERQNFVKRIIGMPGDTVRIEVGKVFVNGEHLDEPYLENTLRQTLTDHVVGEDAYYVLGDNRAQSDDSRHWGDVPKDNVIGKVKVTYWPLDRFSFLNFSAP